jgi:formate transporter
LAALIAVSVLPSSSVHGFQPRHSSTSTQASFKKTTSNVNVNVATAASTIATTTLIGNEHDGATFAPPPPPPPAASVMMSPPSSIQFSSPITSIPSTTTSTTYTPIQPTSPSFSLLNSPVEAFELLVQKGEHNAHTSIQKTLLSSMLGGAYVGMGAMLSLAVAGNAPSLDYGLDKLLFAILFPVNLLLALQCGGQLFTGNTAAMMSAVCEGRATYEDLGKSWLTSWMGNAIGCVSFALLCQYAGVFNDGSYHLAAATLASKTSADLGPTVVKALFANWLVCLAVFLNLQAKDMVSKYLSVLLPVSAFVSMGLEHSVANMFLLPAGLLSPYHDPNITWQTALLKNILPVTIGNAISGSYLVGAAFSYLYGTLGSEEEKIDGQEEKEETMAAATVAAAAAVANDNDRTMMIPMVVTARIAAD